MKVLDGKRNKTHLHFEVKKVKSATMVKNT